MPDSRSRLQIAVEVAGAVQGAREIRGVGQAATDTGKAAESGGKGFGGMAKQLAVAAGSAYAVKRGFDFFKGAADDATQLAKATAGLTRTTGIEAKTASGLVSMTKSRGIETDKLQTSLTAFSKQQVALQNGSKGTVEAFQKLGLTQKDLSAENTDYYGSLLMVADQFKAMPEGAEKTALAVKLFGKQGAALLPILNQGAEGIEGQIDRMDKLGLTMDKNGVDKTLALAKSQRELKETFAGVKQSIGQALIPVILSLTQTVAPVIEKFAELLRSSPLLTTALIALAGAFAALIVIGTIVTLVGALVNPISLVIVGIGALIAALVLAYNKVGWFRAGVDTAFNAIKAVVTAVIGVVKNNLDKILVGALATPLAPIAAVILAFRKWDAIKAFIQSIVDKIKELVSTLGSVLGPLGKAADLAGKVGGVVGGALSSINPFQHGGMMGAGGGVALVGERGPELLQLPGGARVTPLQGGTAPGVDLAGAFGPIHIHLDVGGRELAHVVAEQTSIERARR